MQDNLLLVGSVSDLAEICERAGAAISTVICSSGRVVIFYKDPLTNGVKEADFVDELHIRHPYNAHVLIAVFPVDEG
jgi:hypothetical protein